MKKVLMVFIALTFFLVPLTAIAGEGPMKLSAGANAEVNKHNEEGIVEWNKGDFAAALMHFSAASKIDHGIAETHFNEAICLDKLGKHGDATMHFKAAKKNAKGNASILNSPILNGHIGG